MYRVIVVDDEAWSLVGVRKLLEHRANSFQIIFETTDPVEALERICEERPDIVFTDVRMPEISGIELIHRVRERGIATSFVVVSGFSDFSYVQQALREGAIDYQLKPIDMHKADEMLARLESKLEKKSSMDDLTLYGALRAGNRDFKALLQPKMKHELYQCFQTVTVCFINADFDPHFMNWDQDAQVISLKVGPRKCVYVINSKNELNDSIYSALIACKAQISNAGISRCTRDIDKLSMQLKNSEIASYNSFVDPTRIVSRYKVADIAAVIQLWQRISEALGSNQKNQLKKMMQELPECFLQYQLTAEDATFLWNQIVMSASEYIVNEETLRDLEYLDLKGLTDKFMNLKAMGDYIYEQLFSAESSQSGTVNSYFNQMLVFIDHHYAETLFLQELCNQFFINVSYCCELFRKMTGMTFSQYLTNIRLKNACELLQSPWLSIKDICERVGYNDYFYFNKVFKRDIGCTPAEYRKSRDRGEVNALD